MKELHQSVFVYRKIKNNTFKSEELISIADLTNTKLAFIDEKGNALITFDKEDIKKVAHLFIDLY